MSDKLFQKRRAKAAKDLARRQAQKRSYDKVLIVCEGTKTEPNYFEDLINTHRLSTANVVIEGCGTDPVSIVERAEQLCEKEKRAKGVSNYDRIYCVFDQDDFEEQGGKFTKALDRISRITTQGTEFSAVTSIPCFEVWLILHFEPCTRPFYKTERRTAAQEVERYLKRYLPEYEKGEKGLYSSLMASTPVAVANARRLAQSNQRAGGDNPSTQIHELVVYLQNLKAG